MTTNADFARYRANRQDELDGAALYRTLAEVEAQPPLAEVYRRLALVEERHAQFWEQKLRAAGLRAVLTGEVPDLQVRIQRIAVPARQVQHRIRKIKLGQHDGPGPHCLAEPEFGNVFLVPADSRGQARRRRKRHVGVARDRDGGGGVP